MDKEASIAYAKKYLEDILSFFGLNTDVSVHCDDEVIELSVPSTYLNGFLIGQRGDTLRSLQYVVSMGLKNGEAELNRVNIDVADYKKQRNDRLAEQVRLWCQEVMKVGKSMPLVPMSAVERRVVHHTVSEYGQLTSQSEGEGRERHIIISKNDVANEDPIVEAEPDKTS